MQLPPNLIVTSASLTSSGTTNTSTSGTHIAAPGAGERIRLWALWAVPRGTASVFANWRLWVNDASSGDFLMGANGSNHAAPELAFIPGGMRVTTNTAVGWFLQATGTSLGFYLVTYHTVEAV